MTHAPRHARVHGVVILDKTQGDLVTAHPRRHDETTADIPTRPGPCSALVLAIATVAAAQSMKSADPVADRQRLMKLIGASWADIQAKVKAGNAEAVAVNAETIAVSVSHIPPMFPAGSMTDQSKAKPEICRSSRNSRRRPRTRRPSPESCAMRPARRTRPRWRPW